MTKTYIHTDTIKVLLKLTKHVQTDRVNSIFIYVKKHQKPQKDKI